MKNMETTSRLSLRIPSDIAEKLAERAGSLGASKNDIIIRALWSALEGPRDEASAIRQQIHSAVVDGAISIVRSLYGPNWTLSWSNYARQFTYISVAHADGRIERAATIEDDKVELQLADSPLLSAKAFPIPESRLSSIGVQSDLNVAQERLPEL